MFRYILAGILLFLVFLKSVSAGDGSALLVKDECQPTVPAGVVEHYYTSFESAASGCSEHCTDLTNQYYPYPVTCNYGFSEMGISLGGGWYFIANYNGTIGLSHYYMWKQDPILTASCVTFPDSDSDGIPDYLDSYPNDASPYNFRIIGTQGDCYIIQTDRGDTKVIGPENGSCTGAITLYGSTAWHPSSELSVEMPEIGMVEKDKEVAPVTDLPAGEVDQQIGETDTQNQALQKVIDALRAQNETLKGIYESQKQMEKTLKDGFVTGVGGGAAAPTSSSGGGVSGTVTINDTAANSDRVEAQAEVDSYAAGNQDTSGYTGYGEGDTPQGADSGAIMDKTEVGAVGGLAQSGVSYSSSACQVSFDVEIFGQTKTISFSMCDYASQMQTFGGVLQALTGILCLLILFF